MLLLLGIVMNRRKERKGENDRGGRELVGQGEGEAELLLSGSLIWERRVRVRAEKEEEKEDKGGCVQRIKNARQVG